MVQQSTAQRSPCQRPRRRRDDLVGAADQSPGNAWRTPAAAAGSGWPGCRQAAQVKLVDRLPRCGAGRRGHARRSIDCRDGGSLTCVRRSPDGVSRTTDQAHGLVVRVFVQGVAVLGDEFRRCCALPPDRASQGGPIIRLGPWWSRTAPAQLHVAVAQRGRRAHLGAAHGQQVVHRLARLRRRHKPLRGNLKVSSAGIRPGVVEHNPPRRAPASSGWVTSTVGTMMPMP